MQRWRGIERPFARSTKHGAVLAREAACLLRGPMNRLRTADHSDASMVTLARYL
jgi:hypothetical protein